MQYLRENEQMVDERWRWVQKHMFRYSDYSDMVDDFITMVSHQQGKKEDAGIRGSFKSDPTARAAMLLADPPDYIRFAYEWVRVVDEAFEILAVEDMAMNRDKGIVYAMKDYFGIGQPSRSKMSNYNAKVRIMNDCGITMRTFYNWLNKASDVVLQLALEVDGLIWK